MKSRKNRGAGVLAAGMWFVMLAGCPMGLSDDALGSDSADRNAARIFNYNLSSYVPIPAAGEAPFKSTTDRQDLDILVVWKDEAGAALPETERTFILNKVYQAEITLKAKGAFYFDREWRFLYVDGAVTKQPTEQTPDTKQRTMAVVYKPAAAPQKSQGSNPGSDSDAAAAADYNFYNL